MTLPLTRPVLKGSEIPGTFPNLGPPYSFLLKNFSYLEFSLVFLWNLRRNSDIGTHLLFSIPITSTPIPNLHCQKKFSLIQFSLCYTALLLLLLLSRFSRVRLCATPQTAAHQASPSLGFSRQESWSGVPLPSPATLL